MKIAYLNGTSQKLTTRNESFSKKRFYEIVNPSKSFREKVKLCLKGDK